MKQCDTLPIRRRGLVNSQESNINRERYWQHDEGLHAKGDRSPLADRVDSELRSGYLRAHDFHTHTE